MHYIIFRDDLHLLNDKVEIIPACVREQTRVEGESYNRDICLCVFPSKKLCPSLCKLNEASDANQNQGEEFGISKVILNLKI